MFKMLLVGKPNSGKTTLFNALCKKNEITGNWHGVSSKPKKSGYTFGKEYFEVCDLPGIESLTARSLEEKTTLDYISQQKFDAIVVVSEAEGVDGGVQLVNAFINMGHNAILVVTKYEAFISSGGKLDIKGLNESVCPAYVNAFKGLSLKNFKQRVASRQFSKSSQNATFLKRLPKYKKEILLNPYVLTIIFACIVICCFYCALGRYSVGRLCSLGISFISQTVSGWVSNALKGKSPFLRGVAACAIGGVFAVLEFLPQVVIFEIFLFFIEESGMSERLACLWGVKFCRLGLGLKCTFPLLSGFGCTAIACELCSSCENEIIKQRNLSVLPYISCSAKTLALFFICKSLFPLPFLAMLLAYALQIGVGVCHILLQRALFGVQDIPLILPLSRFCFPPVKLILKKTLYFIKSFIAKISVTVFLTSFAIGVFSCVTPKLTFSPSAEQSTLAFLGKKLVVVFRGAGIYDWRAVTCILAGFFAKESFIGVANSLYTSGFYIPFKSACSLVVFFSLYSPCIVSLCAFAREKNLLFALIIFIKSTVYGYIGAFLTKNILEYNRLPLIFFGLSVIIIGGVSYAVKKGNRNKKRKDFRTAWQRGDRV